MRVITQNLTMQAADPDGYSVQATDVTGPFPLNLVLGGVLASTNVYSGVVEIDRSTQTMGALVGFTTGLTGSAAIVTITGRDINGNPYTELVTMPGASSTVNSVAPFSFISSMSIDGAFTNLSVGIIAATAQVSRWTPLDTYQSPFELNLELTEVAGGATATVEITNDLAIFKPLQPEPDSLYTADAPFAAATASVEGLLLDTPAVAARVKMTVTNDGVWRARWVQSGGGFR